MRNNKYYIGIDTGVNTGYAVWDKEARVLCDVRSLKIHEAMELVRIAAGLKPFIRVEDARLRKWIPKEVGREQLQGAGSIKRDAGIWEDFLKDLGVEYEMVAPKNNKTKMAAGYFNKVTRWPGKTNEHARDAAMLVFGI